jgi:hypothetical protein
MAIADDLLRACEAARQQGKDFPTIWTTILKNHPLVLGLPSHSVVNGEAKIVVSLIDGRRLLSTPQGFSFG